MSNHHVSCCLKPDTCQSTLPCGFRKMSREAAKNTDLPDTEDMIFDKAFAAATSSVQSSINEATHGSGAINTKTAKELLSDIFGRAHEVDPNGLAKNVPGAKLDAGKVRVGLVMSGFARALMEVAKVGTAGANKYTPNGWMEVPNGIERYTDARDRHQLKEYIGEEIDPDFGYLHAAHECWNSLARLDLILRAKEQVVS